MPLLNSFEIPPTRRIGEVWTFARADSGEVWVGADELFLFNGESLEKVDLPFGAYAVRAIVRDPSGKLWIGSDEGIGHLERDDTGHWIYVSARRELRTRGIDTLHIWEACNTPSGLVFVADNQVVRWNGKLFENWPMPSVGRILATRDREALWIFQPGVGLFRMEAAGPHLVIPNAELPESALTWALGNWSEDPLARSQLMLVGGADGVYRRQSGKWIKLERLSAAVAGKAPWRAVLLDENTVAIGASLGGTFIGTCDDKLLAVLDRSTGLPNDSITGLWLDDRNHQLFIGYAGGMAEIDARGTSSVFDARNGLDDAPVLKTKFHSGKTYVLTRRALSVLQPAIDRRSAWVRPISQLRTPLSDMITQNSNLWLSGLGGGIWQVEGNDLKQTATNSSYVLALGASLERSVEIYYAENTKIRALVARPDGGWMPRDLGADIGAYAISMIRDGRGDMWISTATRGIFRFHVESTLEASRLQLKHHYEAGHGLPENIKRPTLTAMGGHILLLSEQCILHYRDDIDKFDGLPGFERYVALAEASSDDPAVAYWIVRRTFPAMRDAGPAALLRVRTSGLDGRIAWDPIDAVGLSRVGHVSGLSFTGGVKPALWIAGSKGLVRAPIDSLQTPFIPPPISLRRVSSNKVAQPMQSLGQAIRFDSNTERIRIEFDGIKRIDDPELLIQGLLDGVSNEWSAPQADNGFEFTGLRPGSYTFQARAVDRFGRAGPILRLPFILAGPWYWSAPAVGGYLVAASLLIALIVRLRLRRLHKLAVQLNQLVDERTGDLARANVARNEFLEGLSHEIRNPLNGLTNLVDLLHDSPLNPEARKLADSLGRSAAHLQKVFGDVLDYTKLEYGHVGLATETFSLQGLIDDTMALFAIQAREKQAELRVAYESGFIDGFCGDAKKIQIVVNNYVSNALKYASGADVEIRVRVEADNGNVVKIRIGVQDVGPGIPVDEQKELFRKFARGQLAKSAGISGTGLGLAICKNIADLLDGRVGLESVVGAGSLFWFEVPLSRAQMPLEPKKPAVSVPVSQQLLSGLALIVEDQEYNQTVLRGIAQRLGYQTELASCSDEVWPLIGRCGFEIVFLDWELPGLSGDEIALQLRKHPNTRDAIIIATTAHDADEIVQRCTEAGMDGFAAKPFNTDEIKAIVEEAKSRRAGLGVALNGLPSGRTQSANLVGLSITAFADFSAGDPARAKQAAVVFLESLDAEMDALRAAISANDPNAIARSAHRLRSHSGLVNGSALNSAARSLTIAARDSSPFAWREYTEDVFCHAAELRLAIIQLAITSSPMETS